MIHANFTEFRKRLAHFMDRANDDRDAILVTRQGSEPVVLLAQSEYEALLETLHLRSSRKNAQRLDEAVAEAKAGRNMVAADWDEGSKGFRPA